MPLGTLDIVNQFFTIVLALGLSILALGALVVGRRLVADPSVRSVLRRAAVITLKDPNMIFEQHAERNPKTKEILVPFARYRVSARILFYGLVAALSLLVVKLLLVLLRVSIVAPFGPSSLF